METGGDSREEEIMFKENLEDFTDSLMNFYLHDYPDRIRDLAWQIMPVYNQIQLAKMDLEHTEKLEKSGFKDKSAIEEEKRYLEIVSKKIGDLFHEIKQEYTLWYDKHLLPRQREDISASIGHMKNIYHWFKKSNYDYNHHKILTIQEDTVEG